MAGNITPKHTQMSFLEVYLRTYNYLSFLKYTFTIQRTRLCFALDSD